MAAWWAEDTHGDREAGGTVKVRFTNNGQEIGAMEMLLVQLIPGELVLWKFLAGPAEWIGTHARFALKQEGDYCIVLFTHEGWKERVEFTSHCSTVGGVPDEPEGTAGDRQGPAQPARHQDRQLELKTPRMNADKVFKALADPTRRTLLDLLCEDNGQTLGQLCEHLDMARQSVTQHLGLLEDANLISTVRRGREKLHFINPVPLHEVYERWVRSSSSSA